MDVSTDCCAICLEPLDNADKLCTLPCEHMFHTHCIFKSNRNDSRCPVCREHILEEEPPPNAEQQSPIVEIRFTPSSSVEIEEMRRSLRNYDARVRRRTKVDAELQRKKDKYYECKRAYYTKQNEEDNLWKICEKRAWYSDEMKSARLETSKARKKFKAAHRVYTGLVEMQFGVRPEMPIDEDTTSLQDIITETLMRIRN